MKKRNTKSPLIGKNKGFKTAGKPVVCYICKEGGGTLRKVSSSEYAHPYCLNKKLEEREKK